MRYAPRGLVLPGWLSAMRVIACGDPGNHEGCPYSFTQLRNALNANHPRSRSRFGDLSSRATEGKNNSSMARADAIPDRRSSPW